MPAQAKPCPHCGQLVWDGTPHDCPVLAQRKATWQAAQAQQTADQAFARAIRCPRCQATNILKEGAGEHERTFMWILAAVVFGLLSLGLVVSFIMFCFGGWILFLFLLPFWIVSFVFFGLPLLIRRGTNRCLDCGFFWNL